jgi:cellulose biosynthesis protein BcsQ
MKTIAIALQKGGTGKTVLSVLPGGLPWPGKK